MVECTLFMTHCLRLNLQLHTISLVRTCPISSFCTVALQLARLLLTRRIARSLGDSWASCSETPLLNAQAKARMHWTVSWVIAICKVRIFVSVSPFVYTKTRKASLEVAPTTLATFSLPRIFCWLLLIYSSQLFRSTVSLQIRCRNRMSVT